MNELLEKYLKGLKIAVVDDSRAFGAGIKSIIESYLGGVDIYLDPKVALDVFLTQPPDLIITDLEMPEMNGEALVVELRKHTLFDAVPIMVLTGKADLETMIRITELGADGFIDKRDVKDKLLVNLFALARQRNLFKKASSENQLNAVKVLIGTYKHEFGNAIAVIDGKLRKLKRIRPELAEDDSYKVIIEWIAKLIDILNKLNELRNYEEKNYTGKVKILNLK